MNSLTSARANREMISTFLHGRFLYGKEEEHTCDVVGVALDGILFETGPRVGPPDGERIILYVDFLGRLSGKARRVEPGSYLLVPDASPRQRERLRQKIDRLKEGAPPEEIPSGIEFPDQNKFLERTDGSRVPFKVRGISLWGTFIETDGDLRLDERVKIGDLEGVVKRIEGKRMRIAFLDSDSFRAASRHFS